MTMNRNDLRKIDFSLLIVFETLMHERNLTRAGEKLFLCQSAISASLNRLRQFFDDPLFIRMGRTMEPTSRAFEIQLTLTPALDNMAAALSNVSEFDPTTSTNVFRIGLSDDVEYSLLPGLLRQLRMEAPQVSFVVRRTDHSLLANQLATGEVSLGVCHSRELPANAKRKFLRSIRPTVLSANTLTGLLTSTSTVIGHMSLFRSTVKRPITLTGRWDLWGGNARLSWQFRNTVRLKHCLRTRRCWPSYPITWPRP